MVQKRNLERKSKWDSESRVNSVMVSETIEKLSEKFCRIAHKMSTSTLFLFIISVTFFSCKGQENKYIYLNAEQLKPLGIELSEEGLFYQNCNPKSEEDGKYPYYAFYSVDAERYVVSSIASGCLPNSMRDSTFTNKKMTENDFYPLFAGTDGKYSFLSEKHDKELVPIAIRMEETKIPNRTDTVVFWFKLTESLRKSLPKGIVIEEYLGLPDIKAE